MPRWSAEKPAVAVVAADDDYQEGYHKGNPGGLDAIETDLAPGNIKDGVEIFGKLGTFAGGPLVEDNVGNQDSGLTTESSGGFYYAYDIAGGGDEVLATRTPTFAAGSRAVGHAMVAAKASSSSTVKPRLIMGGFQVAEGAYLYGDRSTMRVAQGTRALSGAQACSCSIHNYSGTQKTIYLYGNSALTRMPAEIFVGSIKL